MIGDALICLSIIAQLLSHRNLKVLFYELYLIVIVLLLVGGSWWFNNMLDVFFFFFFL